MDLIFTPAAVAFLAALTVLALALALRPSPAAQAVRTRMLVLLEREQPADPAAALKELQGSFLQRVVLPILRNALRFVGRFGPTKTLEDIDQRLTTAGRPGALTATDFLGLCVVLSVLGLIVGILYGRGAAASDPRMAYITPLAGAALGFMGPRFWLSGRAKQRQEAIQRSLPDALDMLTICVEAGLAFEASLMRVSERWHGPLSEEFGRVIAEIRLGVPRSQAMRRMAARCNSPDVQSFVAVLVQADSMGTSIAQVVRSQADQIRVLRRQRAEEKANKAPIKVLIPMVLFIFPALFVIILGPAVPAIMEAFGG